MANANIVNGDLLVLGNLNFTGSLSASLARTSLAQETAVVYPVPWQAFRVWDAVATPLPGDGQLESAVTDASYFYDPTSADDSFFVAQRAYRVLGATGRVEVVGTDGGAVTATLKKAASGTDIAAGTALHTGTYNLKGTVDTNQTLSLSATSTDLDIASGTCIGVDFTGVLTSARGCFTVLLAPAASPDDLRIVGGTFTTGVPSLQTGDLKNAGATTKYARLQVQLPAEYVAGGAVTVRLHSGMVTTVASASATVNVECYKSGRETVVTGSNLYTGAAVTCNSLTFTDKDFAITPTSLSPGDILDIRVAIAVNDSGTGTAVIGCIGSAEILLNIKG
jgi:hypothetical protein